MIISCFPFPSPIKLDFANYYDVNSIHLSHKHFQTCLVVNDRMLPYKSPKTHTVLFLWLGTISNCSRAHLYFFIDVMKNESLSVCVKVCETETDERKACLDHVLIQKTNFIVIIIIIVINCLNFSLFLQNYMVYYYPEYRAGQTPATAVPYDSSPSVFSRIPWVDVGYVVVSLGLIIAGGTVVYNGVGSQVKTRAMRELAGIDFDDASNVARRVLRAIEKFQNMNVETQ